MSQIVSVLIPLFLFVTANWCLTTLFDGEGNYKDISFTLHEGEILSLTGLVGSGRTEIMTTIFGITQPDSGEIFIDGKKVRINRNTR